MLCQATSVAFLPIPAALYASPVVSTHAQKSWSMVPVISLETTSRDQQECPYLRLLIASCQVAFQKAERGGGYPTDHTCTPPRPLIQWGPPETPACLALQDRIPPHGPAAGARAFFLPGFIFILSLIPAKERVHGLTAPQKP